MGARGLLALMLATFTLLLMVSCGGNTAIDGVANTPGTGQEVAGIPSIPLDSGPRVASEGGSGNATLLGSEFIQKFNAEVDGTALQLDATGDGEHFAYGMYQFSGLGGSRPMTLDVECLPGVFEQEYFVAIADYTENDWAWFGPTTFPEFEVDLRNDDHRYVTQLGNLYFLVVTRHGHAATLSQSTLIFDTERPDDAPGAPHSVHATDGVWPEAVVVEWEPGAGAESYEIFRRLDGGNTEFELIGTSDNNGYEDSAVEPGVVYVYKVRSVKGDKVSAFSNMDSGYAGDLHHDNGCPTAIFATDGTYADKVRVEWEFDGGAFFGGVFDVYRKLSVGAEEFQYIGSSQENSYNDFTAEPGVHYLYKVGIEREGAICFSPVDQGYAGEGDPGDGCPTEIHATDGTRADGIMVEWDGIQNLSYDLYRRVDDGEFSLRDTVVGNHFLDTMTEVGHTYYYKVFLHGSDCHTGVDAGTRGEDGGPDGCPTELTASDGESNVSVILEWIGGSEFGYDIYRRADGQNEFAFLAYTEDDFYVDSAVDAGVIYFYKVKLNDHDCHSNIDSGFRSEEGGGDDNCPTELWASDGAHDTWIVLEWNGNAEVTYQVWRRAESENEFTFRANKTGLRFEDDNIEPGTVYFYKIVLERGGMLEGCFSNVDSGFAGDLQ
jgi:fibronectin type 3 domain-containing protein